MATIHASLLVLVAEPSSLISSALSLPQTGEGTTLDQAIGITTIDNIFLLFRLDAQAGKKVVRLT